MSGAPLKCRTVARAALRFPLPEEDATVQFLNAEDIPTFPDSEALMESCEPHLAPQLPFLEAGPAPPGAPAWLPEHADAALTGCMENIEMSVASMRNLLQG